MAAATLEQGLYHIRAPYAVLANVPCFQVLTPMFLGVWQEIE